MSTLTLSQLHVYPLKSAGGIALTTATITARGITGDRRWLLVNPAGQFLTQRQHPQLALIRTQITPTGLILEAPHQPPLALVYPPITAPRRSVQIWRDTCTAVEADPSAHAWFSEFLEQPCVLVYMPDTSDRWVTDPHTQAKQPVSFADAYPFLLLSEASWQDLNHRLPSPVPINRFRPNLVISGCTAYAEDTWQSIRIGTVTFAVVKACSRCVVTTTDQTTAERSPEPLRTLATYRAWDGQIWLGQNLLATSLGTVHVGDRVEVLASAPPGAS